MSIEAMKQALEALERLHETGDTRSEEHTSELQSH